jgi:hypothetical protein
MSAATSPPEVYQRHVWLREISPMIWRRLLVRSDSTIADLHYILQIAMGWEGYQKKLPLQPKRRYPICIGGQRATPPEDCGGPWAFMALQDEYSPYTLMERLTEILEACQAGDLDTLEDFREEFTQLQYWINLEHFDRRAVNRRLRQYAVGDEAWQWQ